MEDNTKDVVRSVYNKLKLELEMERMYHLQAKTAMLTMCSVIKMLEPLMNRNLTAEEVEQLKAASAIAALELDNYTKLVGGETKPKLHGAITDNKVNW